MPIIRTENQEDVDVFMDVIHHDFIVLNHQAIANVVKDIRDGDVWDEPLDSLSYLEEIGAIKWR